MADTGAKFVTVGADGGEGGGGNAWSNPGNITADDASNATHYSYDTSGYTINDLIGRDPDMSSIPAGSTINGVRVDIEATFQMLNGTPVMYLNKASGARSANSIAITNSSGNLWYAGGATSLFGETLTVDDVQHANFGGRLVVTVDSTSGEKEATQSVDFMKITVYYTPPSKRLWIGIMD